MDQAAALSRVSAAQAFAAAAFLLPPIGLLSPNALVILLLLLALALPWLIPRATLIARVPRPLAGALALLLLLGLASTLWSIVPQHSLGKVGQLLFLFAAGLIVVAGATTLTAKQRAGIGLALAHGIVCALLLLPLIWLSTFVVDAKGTFFEYVQTVGHYKRGAALLVLVAGPAAYAIYRRHGRWPAAGLLAIVFLVAYGAASGLAMVAAVAGLAVAILAGWAPHAMRKVFLAVLVAVFVAAPLMRYAPDQASPTIRYEIYRQQLYRISSAFHRFFIWQFAAQRVADRPLLGWGLDASRAIPGGQERIPGFPERLPLHPHNNVMQVWLELGAVGALIAGLAVVWSALRLRAIDVEPDRAIALGMAAAMLATALTGWSLWQSWWMATLWLVAALLIASLPNAEPDHLS